MNGQLDRVIGYFQVGGLFRGSTVYVTKDRIIVNKGRELYLKAHMLVTLLILLVPVLPSSGQLALLFAITAYIIVIFVRRRRSPRREWPSIVKVERGRRQFEVRKDHVLTIELKRPHRLHYGMLVISAISGESFSTKIIANSIFTTARRLMTRFTEDRVRISD